MLNSVKHCISTCLRADTIVTPEARKIVLALQDGINAAAGIARNSDMDRVVCYCTYCLLFVSLSRTEQAIQPPPNSHRRSGARLIGTALTFGVETFIYGNVETI